MTGSSSRFLYFVSPWLEIVSKIATILAVVMAGFWTYYISDITGETNASPDVLVRTQVVPYSHDMRLLVVHVREEDDTKVPAKLGHEPLMVTVKKMPGTIASGFVDMDKQPVAYQTDVFNGQDDVEIDPGEGSEDLVEFVVSPGIYQIEAELDLPDDYSISDTTVQQVQ